MAVRLFLTLLLLALPGVAGAVTLVQTSDPGFYNSSIGTLLNGTNGGESGPFPISNDSDLNFPTAPDLATASAVLGDWLDNPQILNLNWSYRSSIPNSWAVGTEVAIIYRFDTLRATNVVARFGVDNGIFAWLNGQYIGGARRGGGVVLGEHTFTIGDLPAGTHYLQLILEDHGSTNGYAVQIVADTFIPGPQPCPNVDCVSFGPTIVSIPPRSVDLGNSYEYDVVAVQPSLTTPLAYFLEISPAGMTMSSLGEVHWSPDSTQTGPHRVELEARDIGGRFDRQAFYIEVRDPQSDSNRPELDLLFVVGNQALLGPEVAIPLSTTVEFRVNATDDIGVTSRTLSLNGEDIPLDALGRATRQMTSVGLFNATATASDAAGNTSVVTRKLRVYDPTDDHFPTVVVHSPANDSLISMPTDIVVTASDPIIEYWTVDYARVDQVDVDQLHLPNPAWTNIGSDSTSVDSALVGQIDPTILLNDSYVIRVVAQNVNGKIQTGGVIVHVFGDLKFGEFRIEFTDLAIPVSGIPIEITRVYDSRASNDVGDFGYGWSLGIQDARIRETLGRSTLGYRTFYPGTRVYLNTPDGRRVGFTAYAASINCFGFCFANVAFRPDPGVYERLEIAGDNVAVLYDGFFLGGLASNAFDPDNYRLTMKDGTVYEYSQSLGLTRVRDTNGNRLEFSESGIKHYPNGAAAFDESVDFVRDAEGRIVQIVDPAGNPLRYSYDAPGDLRQFIDQAGNLSLYDYAEMRPHYLETIIDPLGHTAIRTEFDEDGRVRSITDALGNVVTEDFDLDAMTGTFTDANGKVTVSFYDEDGNVTKSVDPEGGVTEFQFDANNNEIWKKDARGNVTQKGYDPRGNVTQIIDAAGKSTVMTYNNLNKPTAVTDVLHHTTLFGYDVQGQLLAITNAAGDVSSFTRDSQGRVTSSTDFNGQTTTYDYTNGCACGQPGTVTNPDGTFRTYEYNSFGQVTREVDELGRETVSTYDASGKLLSVRDGAGNTTTYAYNGPLKVSETDPLGRTTTYGYDAANRQTSMTDNAGGVTRFEYDAAGNRTAVIDPVGNRTEFVFDGLNRVDRQIDPLGQVTENDYDPVGNLTEVIDRNGRRRTFEYDPLNRRTLEQWWDGSGLVRTLNYTFNALGLMTGASDPASTLTFTFDDLNRLQSTTQSHVPGVPDFTLTYTYDDVGNVKSVTDNYGVQVGSIYDNRNRLAERTWQGAGITGARVRFGYDAVGNKQIVERYSDLAGTQFVGQSTYEYNGVNAIRHILHENASGTPLLQFDYTRDAAQQITRRILNTQTTLYSYDATGQLTGADYSDAQPDEVYSYDLNGNRTMAGYATGPGNRIGSDGTHDYRHDAEGNMILRTEIATGVITSYIYDQRNRLVQAQEMDADQVVTQTIQFTYDATDRRIRLSVDGVPTHYHLNQDNVWSDLDQTGTISARYLLGTNTDEMLARSWPSREVDWYLADNLGTSSAIMDATGQVIDQGVFEAFGVLVSVSAPLGDRFLFTGREFVDETNTYYYRARQFHPSTGKFGSEDPIGFLGRDMNLFRYAANRPNSMRDPFGTASMSEAVRLHQIRLAALQSAEIAYARRLKLKLANCIAAPAVTFVLNYYEEYFERMIPNSVVVASILVESKGAFDCVRGGIAISIQSVDRVTFAFGMLVSLFGFAEALDVGNTIDDLLRE